MKPVFRKNRNPVCLITTACLIFIIVLYGEDFTCVFRQYSFFPLSFDSIKLGVSDSQSYTQTETRSIKRNPVIKFENSGVYSETHLRKRLNISSVPFSVGKTPDHCDFFAGKWVPDGVYHPLYEEESCPYIQPQLTCKEHGRPDSTYQHWKWKPHGCSLPRFNASFMWEKLRGKRMLFVGDSLNRGQFVSMVCLLHSTLPKHAKSMETFDSLTVFRAMEYNATIEFYWAPFLVESNSDNAIIHRVTERIVHAGSIDKHAQHWKGADILVFNTYLWWMTGMKMKILRGSFKNESKDIKEMETEDAYEMALRSMAKWVEENMDVHKTRVFFTSMSPSHEKSFEWGGDEEGNCFNQTYPIDDPSYWGRGSSKGIMRVIGKVFSQMKVPITFLNITQLSEYRKDAHTSIYKKQWNPLTPEQLANPVSYSDCVHWCLPGLQDTWNELLYAKLFFP